MISNQVTVVGGGITGLSAAYILSKNGCNVTIIEKNKNIGGLLDTFEIAGTYLEKFYHHFFTHDEELMWLLNELDLVDKVVFKNTSMGFMRNGEIYDFDTPYDLIKFKPIGKIGAIRFGLTSLYLGKLANWEKYEEISALKWFYAWAGKLVTESVWRPMLKIKFGPHYDKIPLSWMIGRLRQRLNSRKNGVEQLAYLNGSMKLILDRLIIALKSKGVRIITESQVESLIIKNHNLVGLKHSYGEIMGGEYLFTIPANILSNLLENKGMDLADKLSKFNYFGAVCVVLELKNQLTNKYWLNSADDNYPFGGIIEHTNFISKKSYGGRSIVYLSRYFDKSEEIASMNQKQILKKMTAELRKINKNFDSTWVLDSHIFKTYSAAVINDLGFSKKVIPCKTPVNHLYLTNMTHLYPDERSVNNSIVIAAKACSIMGVKTPNFTNSNSMAGLIGF